jgi:hypothetical protein
MEICDACGKGIGPVRYTRRGYSGVWCSPECRDDLRQEAIRKGGRPRKYRTAQARQDAALAFSKAALDIAREDHAHELGALKIFDPRAAGPAAQEQAVARLRSEMQCSRKVVLAC